MNKSKVFKILIVIILLLEVILLDINLIDFILILISVFIAVFLMINIHEFGHFVFGKIAGYKLISIRIGPLCFSIENEKIKFMFLKAKSYGGLCAMIPPKNEISKVKNLFYYMGGILFNFISAIIAFFISIFTYEYYNISMLFIIFSIISISIGLINALPIMSGNNPSDGKIFWSILLKKPFAQDLIKLNQISSSLSYGTRPKDLDIIKFNEDQEMNFTNVYILIFNYMKALDSKNYAEVDYYIDLLVKNIDNISEVLLPSIYYEICFVYCIKNDIENAKKNYVNAGKVLQKDKDLNGLRIKSYYEYYVNQNTEKAREYAQEALKVADKFPIKGQAIMEVELVKDLLDKIS